VRTKEAEKYQGNNSWKKEVVRTGEKKGGKNEEWREKQ
jgi:hypothetical protein